MTFEGRRPALPAGGGGGRRRGLEAHGSEAGRQGPLRDGLATRRGPQGRRDPEGGKKSSVSTKQRGKEGVSCLKSSRCFECAERLRGPLQARRATWERGSPALGQQMQMRAEPAPTGRSPSPAQAHDPFEAGPPARREHAPEIERRPPFHRSPASCHPARSRRVAAARPGFPAPARRVVHPPPRSRRASATAPFGAEVPSEALPGRAAPAPGPTARPSSLR